jgi:hypothetical protein
MSEETQFFTRKSSGGHQAKRGKKSEGTLLRRAFAIAIPNILFAITRKGNGDFQARNAVVCKITTESLKCRLAVIRVDPFGRLFCFDSAPWSISYLKLSVSSKKI